MVDLSPCPCPSWLLASGERLGRASPDCAVGFCSWFFLKRTFVQTEAHSPYSPWLAAGRTDLARRVSGLSTQDCQAVRVTSNQACLDSGMPTLPAPRPLPSPWAGMRVLFPPCGWSLCRTQALEPLTGRQPCPDPEVWACSLMGRASIPGPLACPIHRPQPAIPCCLPPTRRLTSRSGS